MSTNGRCLCPCPADVRTYGLRLPYLLSVNSVSSYSNMAASSAAIIDFSKCPGSQNPLNPLGKALRCYILSEFHKASENPLVTSIIVTGGSLNFSAGADLAEMSGSMSSPTLIDVVTALESSEKPIIAAINGNCLGGGCEVALACHYRIASPGSKIGLPEVLVGLFPGAGGTQRLPRLVGLEAAVKMILTGAPVKAGRALKMGLIDALVPPNQIADKSQEWAAFAEVMPLRRTGRLPLKEPPAYLHVLCHSAELSLPKHAFSQRAALDAIRACSLPLEEGMKIEGEHFIKCMVSPPSIALRHVFFATREAQKPFGRGPKMQSPLLRPNKSLKVGVIGAGTMGGGIAIVLLRAGFSVRLVDVQKAALEKGTQLIYKTMKSDKLNLFPTTELEDLKDCLLVVEAVVEKLSIKQTIFQKLDRITSPSCILLSNTSTLSIDAMAEVLSSERQFAGWHFFSPANIMPLVEIVRGQQTRPETVSLLQSLTKKVRKTGVVVGNCDGFCGNRMVAPYSAESVFLLTQGATVQQQDNALEKFGMALGPFRMADLAGNDIGYFIRVERGWAKSMGSKTKPSKRPDRYTELADVMVSEHGRLGQKVGKGWYEYNKVVGKGRTPLPSAFMNDDFIPKYLVEERNWSDNEIIERVLFPLVNEGFKCLEEGIVQRPGDIDVVYINGYGWPAWRGGPMFWADHEVGLSNLLKALKRMSREFPTTPHFVPSRLLLECVERNVTVEEYCRKLRRSKL